VDEFPAKEKEKAKSRLKGSSFGDGGAVMCQIQDISVMINLVYLLSH
jgi:hypothetical protein